MHHYQSTQATLVLTSIRSNVDNISILLSDGDHVALKHFSPIDELSPFDLLLRVVVDWVAPRGLVYHTAWKRQLVYCT